MRRNMFLVSILIVFLFGCGERSQKNGKSGAKKAESIVNLEEPTQSNYAKDYVGEATLYFGATYSPVAYSAKTLDKDIKKMKALQMNVVRIGNIPWSLFEKAEDNYSFEWLQQIVNRLYSNGIYTIVTIPGNKPPLWLIEKHPDIIRTNKYEQQLYEENNYNYGSFALREQTKKLIENMVAAFNNSKGIIGWHIASITETSADFSEETKIAWHEWLKSKYKTIQKLNENWYIKHLDDEYTVFTQIPMPKNNTDYNPALLWNWKLFNRNQKFEFENLQAITIRRYSDKPITYCGAIDKQNSYDKMFSGMDFVSTSNYLDFHNYKRGGAVYDKLRGTGKGFYWLLSTTPDYSFCEQSNALNCAPQPADAVKAAFWMNFSYGGQGMVFKHWQQPENHSKNGYGAVYSAWGTPSLHYLQLVEFGHELKKAAQFLTENPVAPAHFAMLYSDISPTIIELENRLSNLNYFNEWTNRFYIPVSRAYLHRDIINFSSDLSQYKIIFIPFTPHIPNTFRDKLKSWISQGGTLLLGPMSGYRTENFTVFDNTAIGNFEEWAGFRIKNRIPVGLKQDEHEAYKLDWIGNLKLLSDDNALLWAETIYAKKGKVIAKYKGGILEGKPAIIETQIGSGKLVYIGTDPGSEAITAMTLKYARENNIEPIASGDKGLAIVPRQSKNSKGVAVVNIFNQSKIVIIPSIKDGTDILTGEVQKSDNLELKPYDVKIIVYK